MKKTIIISQEYAPPLSPERIAFFKGVFIPKTIPNIKKNCTHPLGNCCAPLKPIAANCNHCKFYQ